MRKALADRAVDADIDPALVAALCSSWEAYLPQILSEVHAEWKHESLDGIYPQVVRKTGERRIELCGWCILTLDQTMAPLEARLEVSADGDEVTWLDCKLGKLGPAGMVRIPYDRRPDLQSGHEWHTMPWAYHVGFDHRSENKSDG